MWIFYSVITYNQFLDFLIVATGLLCKTGVLDLFQLSGLNLSVIMLMSYGFPVPMIKIVLSRLIFHPKKYELSIVEWIHFILITISTQHSLTLKRRKSFYSKGILTGNLVLIFY